MDDCFWFFLCSEYQKEDCYNCKKYVSIETEKGKKLLNQYQKDLNKILKPLNEKWRVKMNEYTVN